MTKRLPALLLFFCFASSVPGGSCWAADALRASVSILPQAYFVERVAGDLATVQVMTPKGASPETYEPTPQQLVRLAQSRLFVKVGTPAFPVEKKYLQGALARNRALTVVDMSEGLPLIEEDPHVWTSPAAVRIAAQKIALALQGLDPAHRDAYRRNLETFLRDIAQLDRDIRGVLDGKKGRTFMVYHPAWGYYARDYGLTQLAVEEEGKPLSAAHIRRTVDLAKAKGIRAILVQRGFDAKGARAIARDIGGTVLETDPLERDWLSGMRQVTALLGQVLGD